MSTGLNVGVAKEAVLAARDSILAILKAGRGDDVTIKALEALTEVTSVKNVTITGCTITAKDGGRHGRD